MTISEDERFAIDQPEDLAPLGGTRAQAIQRLQMGIGGVVAITLLVGLASLIEGRAALTEEDAVPQAAATSAPLEEPVQSDPLVEAGVVPDLPATPTPTATLEQPILPEQGLGDLPRERSVDGNQDETSDGQTKAPR